MSAEGFRRRPSFTVGSGPAAGVAAALHRAGTPDAIVIECGGTSTNVSVVKRGRPVLRSIRVMGRPTAIRSIDSWVVGAAGGSMALVGRRRVSEVGPRSAHVAGLDYASFAAPEDLEGAELELVSPHEGDPDRYAIVRAGGRSFALTVTCAANALGLVGDGAHASGSRAAALAAYDPLARRLRLDGPEAAARVVLDGALEKIAAAVGDAARAHELDGEVPLVALGGAAEAIVPELAGRTRRPLVRPSDPEVLSSVGAAISLVRAEVTRSPNGNGTGELSRVAVAREAERACVDAGAAPGTVSVEADYEPEEAVIRAVATGAVALESGAASREPARLEERRKAAAGALGTAPEDLSPAAITDFYAVFRNGGEAGAAVVDERGAVPLAEQGAIVVEGEGDGFLAVLGRSIDDAALNLGVVSMLPRVTVLAGPCMLDLSDARRADEILSAAREAIDVHPGGAVALIAR
jgi:hypothetical protein